MDGSDTPRLSFSLAVNRKHFLDALRQIKKLTGLSGQSAILAFHDQQFCIDLGGCSFRADAEGNWEGQVSVPFEFVRGLAKEPPTGDGPIAVSCDCECLRVDLRVVRCQWNRLSYPRITLPLGASLLEILSLRKQFSREDIRRSDLEKTVDDAESKAMQLIEKAAKLLQPLRFTINDLQRILEEKVK